MLLRFESKIGSMVDNEDTIIKLRRLEDSTKNNK